MNLTDKVVVVTGAGGSIGSEICRQLIRGGVRELRLVSLTESGLYRIMKELGTTVPIKGILGSVVNHRLMLQVCNGADLVIHAAAHKHVPICEQNPMAAIENNVLGTGVLADAARSMGVADFVFISSDKAVKPSSVMGMTKRFAELLLRDHAQIYYQGVPIMWDHTTRFRIVRFGNVLDSDGSVLPLWREQARRGGPITLTDSRCTRFFMSIPEAASLVLGVLDLEPVIGPFVFDMGEPKRMMDLAMEVAAKEGGGCRIVETGLRPGEKLEEELTYGGTVHPTTNPKINVVEEDRSRRLVSHALTGLIDACQRGDREAATKILWSMA